MKDPLHILVDTDAFVGLAVKTDANHGKAHPILQTLIDMQAVFFTTNYVFSESITIISQREDHQAAVDFIANLQSPENPFQIHRIDEGLEQEALEIFKQQSSKNVSYVDCTNIAFMRQIHADAIFSFDRDYRKNKLVLIEDLLATEEEQAA